LQAREATVNLEPQEIGRNEQFGVVAEAAQPGGRLVAARLLDEPPQGDGGVEKPVSGRARHRM
jgi:hypothetical protein